MTKTNTPSKDNKTTSKPTVASAATAMVAAGVALAVCWPLAAPAPAYAQTQAPTNIAQPHRTFDVFAGQSKPGPYELSWQKIEADEIKVVVDGAALEPSAYTVDVAKGVITFKSALKAGAVVRVDYGYFPQTAVRNTKPASVPITVPLLRVNQQTNLEVTALPASAVAAAIAAEKKDTKAQPTAPPQGPDKHLLVANLGGKFDFLGGGLTTSAFLAPDADEKDKEGTFTDRLSMNLGYKVGNDKNGLDALFLRTGSEIATGVGKVYKLGDATQQWGFGGRYAVASWLGMQYSTKEIRDLTGKGSTGRSDLALNLGGVGSVPALNFARTEDVKKSDKDEATRVTTDKLDLAARVGGATELKAQQKTVATDMPDDKKDVTARESTLNLATKLGNVAQVTARGLVLDTNAADDKLDKKAQEGSVAVSAATKDKTAQVSLNLSSGKTEATDDKLDKNAKEGTLAVSAATKDQTAQVSVALKNGKTEAGDDKLDKNAQEKTIAVSAATKDKTAQVSVAVTTGKTETVAAVEEKQGVAVTLQPAPALKITAEQKQQTLTPIPTEPADGKKQDAKAAADALKPKETTVQSAKAEVTPLRGTVLTGTYQMNAEGEKKVSVTDVNAELGKGAFLSIAGGITDRRTTDEKNNVLDTTRAKVALKAAAGLTLSGGMVINPTDAKGKVTEARRQEVGLAAKVGTFELGGGYAITTPGGGHDAFDQPQSGELSLLLGLRFNRFARLDGSVKNSFLYGAEQPGGLRVYTLGFTHELGSTLNFSLGGKMTEDKANIERPMDATAEAKFNLKF